MEYYHLKDHYSLSSYFSYKYNCIKIKIKYIKSQRDVLFLGITVNSCKMMFNLISCMTAMLSDKFLNMSPHGIYVTLDGVCRGIIPFTSKTLRRSCKSFTAFLDLTLLMLAIVYLLHLLPIDAQF